MRPITCALLLASFAIAGCSRMPALPGLTPYKVDIQQGNLVTQDMVDKLKPGMTKSQVRFALGTPLVADPFHSDRWDYIYLLQKRGRVAEERRIVVVFSQDKLLRVDGDVKPGADSAAAGSDRPGSSAAAGSGNPAASTNAARTDKPMGSSDAAGSDRPAASSDAAGSDRPAASSDAAGSDRPAASSDAAGSDRPAASSDAAGSDKPVASK